jgi:hypothetical protein
MFLASNSSKRPLLQLLFSWPPSLCRPHLLKRLFYSQTLKEHSLPTYRGWWLMCKLRSEVSLRKRKSNSKIWANIVWRTIPTFHHRSSLLLGKLSLLSQEADSECFRGTCCHSFHSISSSFPALPTLLQRPIKLIQNSYLVVPPSLLFPMCTTPKESYKTRQKTAIWKISLPSS